MPFSVVGRVGAVGVNCFALMGSRPFVERLEIRLAKRGGIGGGVEDGIGGFDQAHVRTSSRTGTRRKYPIGWGALN